MSGKREKPQKLQLHLFVMREKRKVLRLHKIPFKYPPTTRLRVPRRRRERIRSGDELCDMLLPAPEKYLFISLICRGKKYINGAKKIFRKENICYLWIK